MKRRNFVRFLGGVAALAASLPFEERAENSGAMFVADFLHARSLKQDYQIPELAAERNRNQFATIETTGSTDVSVVAKNATTIFAAANPASKLTQLPGVLPC